MPRSPRIVHRDDVPWQKTAHGQYFAHARQRLGYAAGGRLLGTSLFRLEPGKAAFPAHFHHANEEAILVLSGQGTIRLGAEEYPVGAGDYIALPPGTEEAHQMRNTSGDVLEYLCISTLIHPEITEYPDSGKIGAYAGLPPGGDLSQRTLSSLFRKDAAVDYYDGEP